MSEVTILIYLLVFCALALFGECVMDGIEPVWWQNDGAPVESRHRWWWRLMALRARGCWDWWGCEDRAVMGEAQNTMRWKPNSKAENCFRGNILGAFPFHSHHCRCVSSVFPYYGLCWVSVAVFRTTVSNADGMRYRNHRRISWIVNTHSFTLCKSRGWVRRISETRRGSYVYNNSSSAASHMQQHFP